MDAREYERKTIALHNKGGVFLFKAENKQFHLKKVENVSISGTGLRLPNPIAMNTDVTLTYTEQDWHITITGKIAWSEDLSKNGYIAPGQPRYQVGIEFNSDNLEDNKLFFLALREYIDPFTWFSYEAVQ